MPWSCLAEADRALAEPAVGHRARMATFGGPMSPASRLRSPLPRRVLDRTSPLGAAALIATLIAGLLAVPTAAAWAAQASGSTAATLGVDSTRGAEAAHSPGADQAARPNKGTESTRAARSTRTTHAPPAASARTRVDLTPPEVQIGERLFRETRFAQFFASHTSHVNEHLDHGGDPVVDTTETTGAPLAGPFSGESMNCRACHLVSEHLGSAGGGMRTYADFARRSPIPDRNDGRLATPRNSPPLVDASLSRPGGVILHFDGEFPSLAALVRGTMTGRNYGWLPGEAPQAIRHIARVIREDDGSGNLAQEFGGAYPTVLKGTDPSIPDTFRLPPEFRLNVARANDEQIVSAVSKLVAAYVESLVFEQDEEGGFVASPFDRFLVTNGLPRVMRRGESPAAFSRRLRRALDDLAAPIFIDDGPFLFHDQERLFGPTELAGLRVFLTLAPSGRALTPGEIDAGGIGNCAACHPAPNFTDFGFHNTGVTEREYDAVHGTGAFAALAIPGLAQRSMRPDEFLPTTASHPRAIEPFRSAARADRPGFTDLGVWNIFANPDFPAPQAKLRRELCLLEKAAAAAAPGGRTPTGRAGLCRCTTERLLARSIAVFKTPGLRDLSHGDPYMHDGQFDTLVSVLQFYREASERVRRGEMRNGAPELAGIALVESDVQALAAFLRSLNEDYH